MELPVYRFENRTVIGDTVVYVAGQVSRGFILVTVAVTDTSARLDVSWDGCTPRVEPAGFDVRVQHYGSTMVIGIGKNYMDEGVLLEETPWPVITIQPLNLTIVVEPP